MKNFPRIRRRIFLQNTGLTLSSFLLNRHIIPKGMTQLIHQNKEVPQQKYKNLEQIRSQEKYIMVRLSVENPSSDKIENYSGLLRVESARIVRQKEYFFESEEDDFDPQTYLWEGKTTSGNSDILVIWLDEASEESNIVLKGQENHFRFSLGELLDKGLISVTMDNVKVTASFLLDKEIGEIDPGEINIQTRGEDFDFAILADPQGGDPTDNSNDSTTRLKIHNAFIEESVRLVNELKSPPAFTLILGDIVDSQGQKSNFDQMLKFLKTLKSPVLFELGNHETSYRVNFSADYNLEPFQNYFTAQKQMNGSDKLLYSFNLGKWHFIVWPDPLRSNFWQTHPHYFDWLERDLKKYQNRNTIFLQHIPIHPIGINPMINYVESVEVKKLLFDILSRYGNIKYILSGHVHIPLIASHKTARSYRGITLINLPAAGYRPRGFGEEDFYGGPTQGIAIVKIRGKNCELSFKRVTGEIFDYPETVPEFIPQDWPLWLNHKWQLPANQKVINGTFQYGFEGWARRFVYLEEKDRSNICEIRSEGTPQPFKSLYLYCRKRGYDVPGQDRLPQTINRICQALEIQPHTSPILNLKIKLEDSGISSGNYGAYLWLEGYRGSQKCLNIIYSVGKAFFNLGGRYNQNNQLTTLYYDLETDSGVWQLVTLNIKKDFDRHNQENPFDSQEMDRLIINLGVWNENDGESQPIGIYFSFIEILFEPIHSNIISNINKQPILLTKKENIWNKVVDHIAGEHILVERKYQK